MNLDANLPQKVFHDSLLEIFQHFNAKELLNALEVSKYNLLWLILEFDFKMGYYFVIKKNNLLFRFWEYEANHEFSHFRASRGFIRR